MIEYIEKIDNILKEIGKDYQWLLSLLNRYVKSKEDRTRLAKEYYKKNKHKLDLYHAKYRKEHPEYRNKAKERAKRAKSK